MSGKVRVSFDVEGYAWDEHAVRSSIQAGLGVPTNVVSNLKVRRAFSFRRKKRR